MKRLRDWVDRQDPPIDKIAIDYFGGGNPQYYFGDKYESWWSSKGTPEGWLAVSLTFLSGAHAVPVNNFVVKSEDQYPYLFGKEPVARAGKSIFIYKF